jgi:hypothetical protein
MSEPIRGGYYLKARCIEGSKIAHAPPHARELFDYFLRKAFWRDGDQLRRGQLLTSYKAIQDDLRWYVGNRPERYKRHHIETAVKLLTKAEAITTAKTTRGMIVTVCNYDLYQAWDSYENHSEPDLKPTREPRESPTIDEYSIKQESNKGSTPAPGGFPFALFERFRAAHEDCQRVKDFEFQRALAAYPGADAVEAVAAFERQAAGAGPIRFPVREFEKYLGSRKNGGKEGGGRFPQKNAAQILADEEATRSAIRERLQERPEGEETQAERLKRQAEERERKRQENESED